MASVVFNVAKGALRRYAENFPSAWQMLLLKEVEADDALMDHASVSSMLGASGNTEVDASNYARQTGISASVTQDDTNNDTEVDIPDQTFSSLGNGTNNSIVKAVIAVQTGSDDTTLIPMSAHDFSATTDGNDLVVQIPSNGFFGAS